MDHKPTSNIVNDAIIKELHDSVRRLDFGTVTIKVHDGRITQVEVTRRSRFEDAWRIEGGGA